MRQENLHCPAEIFGFPPSNTSNLVRRIRKKFECPFIGRRCTKQSRLLSYPLGVCSAWHLGTPRIICPNRFYFSNKALLREISKLFLNKEKVEIVPEVRLTGFGNVDWVGFHRDIDGRIEDFCGIEVASDSTTGTGELVRAIEDFIKKSEIQGRYGYGMNTYNTIKLSFIQILFKGQVFQNWEKRYIWLLQDVLLDNMVERFNLKLSKGYKNNQIIFYTVKMTEKQDHFDISLREIYSTKIEKLLGAFEQTEMIPIKDFIQAIRRKSAMNVASQPLNRFM